MSKEKILFRVAKGCLEPYDNNTIRRLRERGYHIGDVLSAELRKPRNPGFYSLAHVFGQMVADNIEAFEGMEPHSVLKRLQCEAHIAGDWIPMRMQGMAVEYFVPQSLSFASMDQGRFYEVFTAMCRHVSEKYWPDLTAEQVAEMAETMPEAA